MMRMVVTMMTGGYGHDDNDDDNDDDDDDGDEVDVVIIFMFQQKIIEGLPPMPPTPNRGDSKVGCGRSKQWFGDG